MASLSLKPLTSNLLSAAVKLDIACFGGFWTLEGYQRELNSPNSDLLALTAEGSIGSSPSSRSWSESLLGLACLWAILTEAHITYLTVHPQFQRQGFGSILLLELLKAARDRGLEQATLEVRASNQAAQSLYQKFGFQTAGRRRRYYANPEEDALILWRGGLQSDDFKQTLAQWQQQFEEDLAQVGHQLIHPSTHGP